MKSPSVSVKKSASVLTQVPVTAGKQSFRIDIGVPAAKLAIEVTGRGKFGESSTSAYGVADRFVARQQMLEAADWRVINITYDQAKKLTPLMGQATCVFNCAIATIMPHAR